MGPPVGEGLRRCGRKESRIQRRKTKGRQECLPHTKNNHRGLRHFCDIVVWTKAVDRRHINMDEPLRRAVEVSVKVGMSWTGWTLWTRWTRRTVHPSGCVHSVHKSTAYRDIAKTNCRSWDEQNLQDDKRRRLSVPPCYHVAIIAAKLRDFHSPLFRVLPCFPWLHCICSIVFVSLSIYSAFWILWLRPCRSRFLCVVFVV